MFLRRPSIFLLLMATALSPAALLCARAQETVAAPAVEAFPVSPQELFAAVAKNARPQWRACFSALPHSDAGDRHRAALLLGAIVADCYLAAEARDAQQLRNQLMDLAAVEKTLCIAKPMASGRQRLTDLAEAGEWQELRAGIAGMLSLHSQTLTAQMDEPLVELESLGLWLRTLQISALHSSKIPNPAGRSCIWSAAFIESLHKRSADAAAHEPKSAALAALATGMGKLKDLWAGETTPANAAERLAATLPLLDTLTASLIYGAPAAPP